MRFVSVATMLIDKIYSYSIENNNVTYLNMIFPDWVAHEHCIEGGHLVDAHARHTNHLGHVVHGAYGQPAAILTLGQVQQRNNLSVSTV